MSRARELEGNRWKTGTWPSEYGSEEEELSGEHPSDNLAKVHEKVSRWINLPVGTFSEYLTSRYESVCNREHTPDVKQCNDEHCYGEGFCYRAATSNAS